MRCTWRASGRATLRAVADRTARSEPDVRELVEHAPGRLDEFGVLALEALSELPTFKGASVVTGDFDILLQLGGDRLTDVLETALAGLQDIAGIVHTSTAVADGTR